MCIRDSIITEAIRKELRRGGQVFYLHNRIDNIALTEMCIRDRATVTRDVPEDAMLIARAEQTVKPGLARRFRREKK